MSAPIIALDATLWDEPTTGIGLYARCLAEGLAAEGVPVRRLGARLSGEAPRGTLGRTRYTLFELPRQLAGVDLYHAVGNFNLPLTRTPGCRFVLTVHDLIPLTHPDTVSRAFRWQFRLWLTRSLLLADRVVCVSEHTRRTLLAHFPRVGGRALVVPNGCDHLDPQRQPGPVERAYVDSLALPERFALYAGSLDVRKNVALVLSALERLGPGVTLVLVGQSWFGAGPVERRIGELRARGLDVRPLGYQPAGVYAEVMRRASLFVFPSLAEGFGLPPLEAMRAGVPVIASSAGALPEVCGEAAVLVDPQDAAGLADAMAHLLGSPEECARRVALGHQQAARFTWKRTAQQTLAVYRTLL